MAQPAQIATRPASSRPEGTVTRLCLVPAAPPQPATVPQSDRTDTRLVEVLRRLARESHLGRRMDPHRACALIEMAPGDAVDRFGRGLLSALRNAAAVRLVFHPAGAAERTFAERWLVGLVEAYDRGDADSVRFAIERAVSPAHRRTIRFLARGFSEAWSAATAG